jgi:hypothetical protein
MTQVQRAVVAIVCGMLFALVASGCSDGGDGDGGGDDISDLADFPDVRGTYTGRGTLTTTSECLDPELSGTFMDPVTFTISQQSGASFSGEAPPYGTVIEGRVTRDGEVQSTWMARPLPLAWEERHTGTLTGNTWTDTFTGRYTVGETCTYRGETTARRQ